MRLIDADALIADIRKNSASYFADDFAHEWVDRQPTIEIEVIRCKDCIHNNDCDIQYHAQAGDAFYCGTAERGTDE